jgi:hypothetical protein
MTVKTWLPLALAALSGCIVADDPHAGPSSRPRRDRHGDDAWNRALRQPLPPGNVRVTIDTLEFEAIDRTVFEAALRYKDPNVTVQIGGLSGRNGLLLFAAKGNFTAAFRAESPKMRRTGTRQEFLTLMPGSRGRLQVLQSEPVSRLVLIPLYGGGAAVVRTIQERVTGSGLEVQVHSAAPDGVDLELMPYFTRAVDGGALLVTELNTRFVAAPGQPYAILADRRTEAAFAQTFFSVASGTRRLEVIKVLTVQVGGSRED